MTTNDGEFMQITLFSKQDGGMLIWQKEHIHSPVGTMHFIIPYSNVEALQTQFHINRISDFVVFPLGI